MSYKFYLSFIVLFVLLLSFFALPAEPARAGLISRAPNNLGLVGYWPMNESRGQQAGDFSGQGNTGTITGGSTWVDGKRGKALSFNGSTNYVRNATAGVGAMGTSDFSVSLWVKDGTIYSDWYETYITPGNGDGVPKWETNWSVVKMGSLQGSNAGKIAFEIGKGSGSGYFEFLTPNTVNNGSWHQIVAVASRQSSAYIYIDGVEQASTTISSFVANLTAPSGLSLGSNNGPGGFNTDATMDEVRLYNRALSVTEIAALYRSGQTTIRQASNQGLVGYWPMNEGRGQQAGDSSGQGNTGTITGASWVDGKRGKALNFNGTSDYINAGSASSLKPSLPISFSAWFKINTLATMGILSFREGLEHNGYQMYIGSDGSVGVQYGSDTECGQGGRRTKTSGASVVSAGQWYFMVGILTGATDMNIYINGVDVGGSYTGTGGAMAYDATSFLSIGRQGGTGSCPGNFFKGLIDEVRLYNRALSATEIATLYRSGSKIENVGQNNKLTNGLVGLWSFNGYDYNSASTTAEVLDRSGQGYNGDNIGAVPSQGKVGQALKFDGVDDYVTAGSIYNTINSDLTISAWVKQNSFPDNAGEDVFPIAGKNNASTSPSYWFLATHTSTTSPSSNTGYLHLRFYNGTSGGNCSGGTLYPGQWHHVVGTRASGTDMVVYVDGQQVYSCNVDYGSVVNAANFEIGRRLTWWYYFPGSIDEVRVYNRAISADEVKQLYNLGR